MTSSYLVRDVLGLFLASNAAHQLLARPHKLLNNPTEEPTDHIEPVYDQSAHEKVSLDTDSRDKSWPCNGAVAYPMSAMTLKTTRMISKTTRGNVL